MASLATVTPANFLTLEALALAITLDATVVTTTRTSLLADAAAVLHVPVILL